MQLLTPQANRSGTRMREDQEWTNMLLPQTYSPPSLVDSVEEKPAEEIDEDDPDHEIDCDLPHCMYSFCFLRERSLFTAGGGLGGGLAKLFAPQKIAPPPKEYMKYMGNKSPPTPMTLCENFCLPLPPTPPAYFKSMPLCVWVLMHIMSLSPKKQRNNALKKILFPPLPSSLLHENRSRNFCPHAPPLPHHHPPWP